MTDRPPLPPFDHQSALTKVQAAEDAWNTRDPERVAGAYRIEALIRTAIPEITGVRLVTPGRGLVTLDPGSGGAPPPPGWEDITG